MATRTVAMNVWSVQGKNNNNPKENKSYLHKKRYHKTMKEYEIVADSLVWYANQKKNAISDLYLNMVVRAGFRWREALCYSTCEAPPNPRPCE